MRRFFAIVGIAAVAFLLPWWTLPPVALALSFRFNYFYEAALIALLTDSMWSADTPLFFGFRFVSTLATVAMLAFSEALKRRMIFYSDKRGAPRKTSEAKFFMVSERSRNKGFNTLY
ncbi:MAG: hypothetical protein G01um101472_206 [Parcubacteria group bacterium Gr01-1014_72]|nr:MAG: hypothetical protein G01um101472_206 [Parcubacteria group bacterium Gr01-1014_72]